jgi:hypothetical protein
MGVFEMPPAIIAAGIGAAASVGGAVLSAKAQKKAASTAANAATATADKNNALQREVYAQNYATLNPYAQRGNQAGNAINSLLGLGQPQNQGGPQAMQLPQNSGVNSYNPAYGGYDPREPRTDNGGYGGVMGQGFSGYPGFNMNQPQGRQTFGDGTIVDGAMSATNPQQDYQNAFDNYQNSTGFQFRQEQGNNALNTGYAARGSLRSGAAMKDFARFNQNIASQEFGNYLGQLGNQQNVGLSGASAIAGVGQNMAGAVSANNDSAGTAAANAALLRGQANSNMYGSIASGLGQLGGSVFGSSFGGGGSSGNGNGGFGGFGGGR